MSLFSDLGVATRGLSAAQTALTLVGQNVTNANTEGYTRKRLEMTAGTRRDAQFGQMGFGVELVAVRRLRDELLDRQIQETRSEVGRRETLDTALGTIEGLFTEPSEDGVGVRLEEFWNAWQDVANNPSDQAARQAVIDAGDSLASRFNMLSDGLVRMRADREQELGTRVAEINALLANIAATNRAIASAELGGLRSQANDSRDERERLVSELADKVDVAVEEDAQGRYTVVSSGKILVSPIDHIRLEVITGTAVMADGTTLAAGTLRIEGTNQAYVPRSGSLRGLFEVRDEMVPRYQNAVDTMARELVVAVNGIHVQAYDGRGVSGVPFFDPATTGAADIALSSSTRLGPAYVAAGLGGASLAPAAPVSAVVPGTGTPLDLTTLNPVWRNLVEGTVIVRRVGPPPTELTLGASADYVVDLANGRLRFLDPVAVPPGTAIEIEFRYRRQASRGEGDGAAALAIARLRTESVAQRDVRGVPHATLAEAWSSLAGALGAERRNGQSELETQVQLRTFYKDRIAEISGVSIDEEMSMLVRYQHSYQASARFLTTVSDLLQTLINM